MAFDEFLDFGIPSKITVSKTDTFDGLHYVDAVNQHVMAALMSGQAAPGIDWTRTPFEKISAAYEERIGSLVLHPKEASKATADPK